MNKIYFFCPLLALLLFSGFYLSHRRGTDARELAKSQAAEAALLAKNAAELNARKAAMTEAIATAAQRKIEKEAKAARETAQKAARQDALEAREKAFRDKEKSAIKIERIQKEIAAEQTAIEQLATARKAAEGELAFLQKFVTKAQANLQALQAVLAKSAASVPAPASAAATPK